MMSEISCEICFSPYGQVVTPRMLPCGHSICSGCLISLLEKSKFCPVCRIDLPHDDETKYPINYTVLKMCQRSEGDSKLEDLKYEMKELEIDDSASGGVMECVAKELERLEHARAETEIIIKVKTEMKDLLNRYNQNDDDLAKIETLCAHNKKNKHELIQLIQKDVKFDDVPTLKETLEEMEEFLNEMPKIINNSFIAKFKEKDIRKIYEDVGSGKKVEAVGSVEGEEKIWRMSIEGDKLLLHQYAESASKDPSAVSLQYDEVLKQMEEGGNLAPFFDIESEDRSEKWRLFLHLSEDEGVEQLRDLFIRLVTGQEGKEGGYRGGGGAIYCYEDFYISLLPGNIEDKLYPKYKSLFKRTEHAADVADAEWKLYLNYYGSFGIFPSRPGWPNCRLIGKVSPKEGDKVKEILNYLKKIGDYSFNVVDSGVAVKVN